MSPLTSEEMRNKAEVFSLTRIRLKKKDVHVPIASKNEVDYLTYFLRELFRLLVILYS